MTPIEHAHNALLMLTKGLYSKGIVNESLNAGGKISWPCSLPTGELLLLG